MDTGLQSIVAIERHYKLPVEADRLVHQFGIPGQRFSNTELLLAARALTLKAKCLKPALSEMCSAILPAIAKTNNRDYLIVTEVVCKKTSILASRKIPQGLLIRDLRKSEVRPLSFAEFEGLWSGELISLNSRQQVEQPRASLFSKSLSLFGFKKGA